MKKSFALARYVEGTDRSYINIYFETKKGERVQKKPTFGLGFLKDKRLRQQKGKQLETIINWWLSRGYWYEDFSEYKAIRLKSEYDKKEKEEFEGIKKLKKEEKAERARIKKLTKEEKIKLTKSGINIIRALHIAGEIKKSQTKKRSVVNNINSDVRMLCGYLKKKKLHKLPIDFFTRKVAIAYLDYYLQERKCSHTTYNNVISNGRKLLEPLIDLEYLEINPFVKIKTLRPEEPTIRNFEPDESKLVRDYIYKHDRLLFYALILQLGCYIRPNEIRQLKFGDILFDEGLIRVDANVAKNSKTRYATIPYELEPFLKEEHFCKYPADFFVFGEKRESNATKPIGRDYFSKQHKIALDLLHKRGDLKNRANLKFYSWKYTGITIGIETVGLVFAKDQAGHSKVTTTMRYRRKKRVNEKMRLLKVL